MNVRLIIAIIHTTQVVVKLKPEKNSGLNGIRTHDLCGTSVALYQLSYQAIWELVTLLRPRQPSRDRNLELIV